ncbi:MAG: hypothetical protein PVF58_17925 [Candidatus Methanofastidiosia archaeon]|jgi:hypothetical protein
MKKRKIHTLKIARDTFEENPRIPLVHLHRKVKKKVGVRMRDTTTRYIKEGLNLGVIRQPRPLLKYHDNVHQHISFIEGNLLDFEEFTKKEKDFRYACALSGESEIIMVTSFSSSGQDLLYLAFTRANGYTLEERQCLKKMSFSPKEEPRLISIPTPTPHLKWEGIDWGLFYALSPNLRISYAELSENIHLGWRAIKNKMKKKILPSCSVATYFFPKGQGNYQQLYVQFKTEYQKNFLEKFDYMPTTVYFMLFENKEVGLILFPENINEIIKFFKKIEIEGIIDDFRHLTPLAWYHSEGSGWAGPGT